MATTTQILFNSPALHSLKRDQLVRLCKRHGIKANGKNVELIERLKVHAQQLPPDAATIEYQDESNTEDNNGIDDSDISMTDAEYELREMGRPSEKWTMVMEDIEEVDEPIGTMSSTNTLSSKASAGEFGSRSSKKTMSSSIKSIANSLGIKRAHSSKSVSPFPSSTYNSIPAQLSELEQHAVPYSALPPTTSLPSTDHFKLSTPDISMGGPDDSHNLSEPIPGSPTRPGAPVPSYARLGTGDGLTTTIRLISSPFEENTRGNAMMSPPKLQAVQPSFDLIMSPEPTENVQSPPGDRRQSIYPALPLDDLPSLNAIVASAANSPAKFPLPKNDTVDIFSPAKAPPSSKKVAGSRLSLPQNQPFLFGSPLPQPRPSNKDFGAAAASVLDEMNKRLEQAGIQKVNSGLLDKDSSDDVFGSTAIPTMPKAKEGAHRFAKAHEDVFGKMDSIANHYAARRPAGGAAAVQKRKSDAPAQEVPPSNKRKSTVRGHTGQRVISNGVRKNMTLPGGFGDEGLTDSEEDAASNNIEEEDAGDRRASKRIRMVADDDITKGKRISIVPTKPAQTDEEREKAERRKSRDREAMKRRLDAKRRNSRGRQSIGKSPAKPRFGFFSSAKNLVRNVWNMGAGGSKSSAAPNVPKPSTLTKPLTSSTSSNPPATKPPFTTSLGLGHPASKPTPQASRASSTNNNSTNSHLRVKTAPLGSARTRSPIPSFAPAAKDQRATSWGQSSTGIASRKNSVVPRNASGGLDHTRKVSNSSVGSNRIISPVVPKRPAGSSRLMAPTASSLAKMTSPRTLQSILNTPLKSPRSSQPSKIFSKPLGDLGSPTTVPTPIKNTSLGVAASVLMGANIKPVPPKPQSLAARKPRVSRTRVIAKLGAQRAAASGPSSQTSSAPSILKSPPSNRKRDPTSPAVHGVRGSAHGGKARSSIGSDRISLSVVKNNGSRVSSGGDVLMSARKKVRQSEYLRRRSGVKAARASLAVANGGPSVSADKRMSMGTTPLKSVFVGFGSTLMKDDD